MFIQLLILLKKNDQQILQSHSWNLNYFSIKKYKTWEVCMEVLYPFSIIYVKVPIIKHTSGMLKIHYHLLFGTYRKIFFLKRT